MPLPSCYKELRGVKYCFLAADALAYSAEREIPPELVEHIVLVGGLWGGQERGKRGPHGRAGLCPLFPFQADGAGPVTCVSLAGGRGLQPAREVPLTAPALPARQGMQLAIDVWKGGSFSPRTWLPVCA